MNSRNLLLVEDEPESVALFEYAAGKVAGGLSLRVARDGVEALEYLAGTGAFADRAACPLPDVIVLDLKMPRATGFEVLEQIRQRAEWSQLIVIVFTASSSDADITKAYQLGANAFVVKPSSLADLISIVQAIAAFWFTYNVKPEHPPSAV